MGHLISVLVTNCVAVHIWRFLHPSIIALANSETPLGCYFQVLCINAKGHQGGFACLPDVLTFSYTGNLDILLVLEETN